MKTKRRQIVEKNKQINSSLFGNVRRGFRSI